MQHHDVTAAMGLLQYSRTVLKYFSDLPSSTVVESPRNYLQRQNKIPGTIEQGPMADAGSSFRPETVARFEPAPLAPRLPFDYAAFMPGILRVSA